MDVLRHALECIRDDTTRVTTADGEHDEHVYDFLARALAAEALRTADRQRGAVGPSARTIREHDLVSGSLLRQVQAEWDRDRIQLSEVKAHRDRLKAELAALRGAV